MTKTSTRMFLAGTGAAAAVVLAACGGSSGGSSLSSGSGNNSGAPASGGAATVTVHTTSLGSVLADSSGKTVYLFSIDTPTKSNCTGACLSVWAPVTATGQPTPGSGVTATLTTVALPDGTKQVAAGNHLLYTYTGDSGPGSTSGHGLNTYGGTWAALSASGSPITMAAGGASPSQSSGGYTY